MGVFATWLHKIVSVVSGEFLLTWPHRRANGGTMILVRSLWVSSLLYAATLSLRALLDPANTWHFDFTALRILLAQTLTLFGGFFAGVYVALYARFSSQWTYLAGLYNQMMAAAARPDHDKRVLVLWKAGFIEDADELHLALKPMYAAVIKALAEDSEVVKAFSTDAPGGAARFELLLKDVSRVFKDVDRRWIDAAKPRTTSETIVEKRQ